MALPFRITPLAPTLAKPFHRPGWVYEEKYDGWRMVAYKDGAGVRLVSRHGVDHTARYPELTDAIGALPAPTLILDGEVCRFDEQLVSRFHLLPDPEPGTVCSPSVFVAFDILHVRDQDLRAQPLRERRKVLEDEVGIRDHVVTARRLPDDGLEAWAEVQRQGYEGLVAKDGASTYLQGGSTRRWLKVKVRHEGRFAVGGIIEDDGWCGGVLVGERTDAGLVFRGLVEFGVRGWALVELLTQAKPLVRATSPFVDLPKARDVIWLESELVAEVTYAEVMQGRLRDPVFRCVTQPEG